LHGVNSQIGELSAPFAATLAGLIGGCDLYFGAGPGSKSSILPVAR
jgi:hypothetical protein